MRRPSGLTNRDAEDIRRRWATKPTMKKLAAEYGTSVSVIRNILSGEQYKTSPEERERLDREIQNVSYEGGLNA